LGSIVHFGGITGGHFNPAVTLGVLIREGRESFVFNLVYAGLIIIS
jgi:glycerol uptake facilitator-like aquaporin